MNPESPIPRVVGRLEQREAERAALRREADAAGRERPRAERRVQTASGDTAMPRQFGPIEPCAVGTDHGEQLVLPARALGSRLGEAGGDDADRLRPGAQHLADGGQHVLRGQADRPRGRRAPGSRRSSGRRARPPPTRPCGSPGTRCPRSRRSGCCGRARRRSSPACDEAPTTATVAGSKKGRSDATTATWSRSADALGKRLCRGDRERDLGLAALERARDLEPGVLEDAHHRRVRGHHLGDEALDALLPPRVPRAARAAACRRPDPDSASATANATSAAADLEAARSSRRRRSAPRRPLPIAPMSEPRSSQSGSSERLDEARVEARVAVEAVVEAVVREISEETRGAARRRRAVGGRRRKRASVAKDDVDGLGSDGHGVILDEIGLPGARPSSSRPERTGRSPARGRFPARLRREAPLPGARGRRGRRCRSAPPLPTRPTLSASSWLRGPRQAGRDGERIEYTNTSSASATVANAMV